MSNGRETDWGCGCPLCSGGNGITKRNASCSSAVFARDDDPSCIFIPHGDETPCPAGVRARELVGVQENAAFRALLARDGLEKRDRKVYMYTTSTGITINLDTATFPNCGAAIANRPQNYFWNYIARGLGDGVNNCRPCARQQQNESPEGNILQDAESVSRLGLAGRHYDLSLPSSPISPTSPPRLRTRRQFGTSSSV